MAKVSVICTVYNGERYADRGLPSVLNQTYDGKVEYVVVDDGSTDGTPELLREIGDRNPRVRVYFPGRLGRADALNYAVEKTSGDLIAQQDFDDLSRPDRIRAEVEYLETRPDVGIVGGHCEIRDEKREESYIRRAPLTHREVVRTMGRYIPFAHTLVMFRKQAWKDAGGYPRLETAIDFGFMLKVAEAGWKLEGVDRVLGTHYVHRDSYWHREFSYYRRQAVLAKLQARVIGQLGLPTWSYVFPLGRFLYPLLPSVVKRVVRRHIGGVSERRVE